MCFFVWNFLKKQFWWLIQKKLQSNNPWQFEETCLHPLGYTVAADVWVKRRAVNHLFSLYSPVEIMCLPSNMPIQLCQITISKAKMVGWSCQATVIFAFLVGSLFLSLPDLLHLQLVVPNVEKVIEIDTNRNNPLSFTNLSKIHFFLYDFFF